MSLEELFPNFSNEFLEPFKGIIKEGIKKELHLDFSIAGRVHHHKVSPILRLARLEDAESLVQIYKELYDETYPYKEMEDLHEVRKMLEDPTIQWIIFQDPSYNIAGCVTFVLDFPNKRGYIRGFMLKEQYQGYIDITKAMIGSMLGMLHKYKDIIYTWYVENRTAHSKSQYSMHVCGIAPIGFFPNKDIFMGKVESDLMQILYDEKALKELRSTEVPKFIPQVDPCFDYSMKKYGIPFACGEVPEFTLDKSVVRKLRKKLRREISSDEFGYETITLTLKDSDSYFQFLYTPQVQNCEKTKYKVISLEELYIFVREFLKCKKELGVRYCEVFVSAYKREHQQIFYDAGFRPRGYIPSWEYSIQESMFKDSVLFSLYDGVVSADIQLIDQGYELLNTLGIAQFSEVKECGEITETRIQKRRERIVQNLFDPKNLMKYSLRTAMSMYLLLLVISLFVAMGITGFDLTIQVISDLGNSLCTPVPFLFDTACGVAGTITIPFSFCIYRIIGGEGTVRDKIFTHSGLICGVIGGLGYMCVGIFSLDRSGPNGIIHNISAIIAFTGFVFSIFFFSISAFLHKRNSSKLFGVSGIMIPLIFFILNGIFATPLLEWLLLFAILSHIVPLNYWSVSK